VLVPVGLALALVAFDLLGLGQHPQTRQGLQRALLEVGDEGEGGQTGLAEGGGVGLVAQGRLDLGELHAGGGLGAAATDQVAPGVGHRVAGEVAEGQEAGVLDHLGVEVHQPVDPGLALGVGHGE